MVEENRTHNGCANIAINIKQLPTSWREKKLSRNARNEINGFDLIRQRKLVIYSDICRSSIMQSSMLRSFNLNDFLYCLSIFIYSF